MTRHLLLSIEIYQQEETWRGKDDLIWEGGGVSTTFDYKVFYKMHGQASRSTRSPTFGWRRLT